MAYYIKAILLCFICKSSTGFLGVSETKCSLIQSTYNDPCNSLYSGVCDGSHCKCPPGTIENKILGRCATSRTSEESSKPKKGPSEWDDLPVDYNPTTTFSPKTFHKDNITTKPKNDDSIKNDSKNSIPPLYPQQPNRPGTGKTIIFPDNPKYGGNDPTGRHSNNVGYKQPYPDISVRYPNQPGYTNPNQPDSIAGVENNHFGYGRNNSDRRNHRYHLDEYRHHTGRNSGTGIGGGLSFIIMIAIIYFCCCRGEKGKTLRNKLAFGPRSGAGLNQPGVTYQLGQTTVQQPGQLIYVPQQPNQQVFISPQPVPVYPGQQPGPVYPGQQPGPVYPGQQPGPVYPPPQPGQVYPPPLQPGEVYPPLQTKSHDIGFGSPPPPYTPQYQASAPPPA